MKTAPREGPYRATLRALEEARPPRGNRGTSVDSDYSLWEMGTRSYPKKEMGHAKTHCNGNRSVHDRIVRIRADAANATVGLSDF